MEEKVLVEGLEKGTVEWQDFPAPDTVEEILAVYDQNHEDLTRRLRALDGAVWEKEMSRSSDAKKRGRHMNRFFRRP